MTHGSQTLHTQISAPRNGLFRKGGGKVHVDIKRTVLKKTSETVQQNAHIIVHRFSCLLMNSTRDRCRKEEVCSVPATVRM